MTASPQHVADPAQTTHHARTSNARANLELLVVGFGALVVSLAQTVLVPVLPTLPVDLHTSASNVNWLLTSTLLVAAVSVPILGRLGDMYGKRLMLLVALVGLTVGSLITAVSSDIGVLIAGRAITGISSAAIPLGISLLASLMPRERVASSVALISAMLGVGGALGLPLAGFVAEHADFHALFWVTGGAGLLSILGILAVVPEAPGRAGGRVDYLGAIVLGVALVCLLLPLAETADWGWGDPRVAGLLVAAVVLLGVFGWIQTRVADPLVDLAALRRRPIVLTNVASILFGFALFASLLGTASYVEAPEASGYGFGSSLLVGGLALLPSGLMMLLLAPVAARLINLRGAPQTLALGALIVALGWALRIVVHDNLAEVIVGTTIVGMGTGIGYAAIPSLINAHTPSSELSSANGLNSLFRSFGSSLASAVGGSILAGATVELGAFAVPSLDAYRILFGLCAGAAVLAALVVLVIPRDGVGSAAA